MMRWRGDARDLRAVEQDRSCRRHQCARQHVEDRALAGAVRADQAENLALLDAERYALLTAVKPPKRFTNPSTVSTQNLRLLVCWLYWLLNVVPFGSGSTASRCAWLCRPHHVRPVVDILDHHRKRALVLAGHLACPRRVYDSESPAWCRPREMSTSSAALPSASGSTPPYFLMARGQHFGQEHVGFRRGHADMRGTDRTPASPWCELLADHRDDRRQLRVHRFL